MPCVRVVRFLTAVSLFLVFGAARSEAGLVPAGEDFFSSRGTVSVEIYDPFYPGGFTEVISLSSNGFPLSHVHRDAQVVTTINTEMVSLDLAGISANVGYVHLRVGAGNATPVIEGGSFGQITNVVTSGNNFVSGDSYFNIFFELDVQSYGVTLYNKLADPDVVVANGIFRLPPFNRTYQSFQTVALWADVQNS